jgi:hypothetical protein
MQCYTASDVVNPGRRSVSVGPPTRTPTLPATLVQNFWSDGGPGFPSTFPPPEAKPCGTGWNSRGRQVTAEAVDRSFVHVTSDIRDQKGMGRDSRGEGGACKIAGIAYTGSNPVPATHLACVNTVV